MDRINVAVRFRPLNSKELSLNQLNSWDINESSATVNSKASLSSDTISSFSFDRVFGPESTNQQVYDNVVSQIISSALDGVNGTIFAYGQTSSGKTFTMYGDGVSPSMNESSSLNYGIIGLAMKQIFDVISATPNREYLLRVSFMEIYNEVIKDLLDTNKTNLKIHENLDRNIYVGNLTEELVTCIDDVFQSLAKGDANRHIGETNMNERSSRSHTIFRMVIESRERSAASSQNRDDGRVSITGAVKVSTLNLVDLAGSERVGHTGAEGIRLKEGGHINKSLLALGTVIAKLAESSDGHIPYRDSKLTRILQPSLGGNARTAIICTATPSNGYADETISTLKFASRAKSIRNKPQVNEILSDEALLKRYRKEINSLKRRLEQSGASEKENISEAEEIYKQQLQQKEEEKNELMEKLTKLKHVILNSATQTRELKKAKSLRRQTWFPGTLPQIEEANEIPLTDSNHPSLKKLKSEDGNNFTPLASNNQSNMVDILTRELQKAKVEIKESAQIICGLQKDRNDFNSTLGTVKSQWRDLTRDTISLKKYVRNKLLYIISDYMDLKTAFNAAKKCQVEKVDFLEVEAQSITVAYEELSQEFSKLQKELDEKNQEQAESSAEIEKYKAQVCDLQTSISKLKSEKDEISKDCTDLAEKNFMFERDISLIEKVVMRKETEYGIEPAQGVHCSKRLAGVFETASSKLREIYDAEILELKQQLSTSQSQTSALVEELQLMKAIASNLEVENNKLVETSANLKDLLSESQAEKVKIEALLEKHILEYEAEKDSYSRKISELTISNEELSNSLDRSRKSEADNEVCIIEIRNKLDQLAEESAALKVKLEEAEKNVSTSGNCMSDLELELRGSKEALDQSLRRISELEDAAALQSNSCQELEVALMERNGEVQSRVQEIQALKAELLECQSKYEQASSITESSTNEINRLKEERDSNASKLESLQSDLIAASSQMEELKTENSRLTRELCETTEKLSISSNIHESLNQEHQSVLRRCSELESRIQEITVESTKSKDQCIELEARIASVQQDDDSRIVELKETISGLQEHKSNLNTSIEDLKNQLEQSKSTIIELNLKIEKEATEKASELALLQEKFNDELKEKESTNETLFNEISQLREAREILSLENEVLKGDEVSLKELLKEKTDEISNLNEKLDSLSATLKDLESVKISLTEKLHSSTISNDLVEELENRLAEQSPILQQLRSELQMIKTQYCELEKTKINLEIQIDERNEEIRRKEEGFEQELVLCKEELISMKELTDSQSANISSLRQELETCKSDNELLTSDLNKQKCSFDELKLAFESQVAGLKQGNELLEAALEKRKTSENHLKADRLALEEKVLELRLELDDKIQQISTMNQSNSDGEAEHKLLKNENDNLKVELENSKKECCELRMSFERTSETIRKGKAIVEKLEKGKTEKYETELNEQVEKYNQLLETFNKVSADLDGERVTLEAKTLELLQRDELFEMKKLEATRFIESLQAEMEEKCLLINAQKLEIQTLQGKVNLLERIPDQESILKERIQQERENFEQMILECKLQHEEEKQKLSFEIESLNKKLERELEARHKALGDAKKRQDEITRSFERRIEELEKEAINWKQLYSDVKARSRDTKTVEETAQPPLPNPGSESESAIMAAHLESRLKGRKRIRQFQNIHDVSNNISAPESNSQNNSPRSGRKSKVPDTCNQQ